MSAIPPSKTRAGMFQDVVPLHDDKRPFRTLNDDIYATLRGALMAGDLLPGYAISIRTLADQFGTSMIPVRDALKRLVAEQALTMLPNRTVVISRMTRRRFQEILSARLSLETKLALQATELIKPQEISALERINDEMQDAVDKEDVKRYLLANRQFHFNLYAAAQSTVILPIVEALWVQVGPFLNGVFTASGTSNASDSHEEVLRAVRRRDSVKAADAIARDLADAADAVLAQNEFVLDGELNK